MIKKFLYTVLIVFLFISEGLVAMVAQLPNHFQCVPYFVYTMLMLLIFKYQNKWILGLTIICALSYDILYSPYYMIFLIIYLLSYMVITQIKKIFFVNFFVVAIVILLGITISEFTLYMINVLTFPTYSYFLEYVSHRLGISLLINGCIMVILYVLVELIEKIKKQNHYQQPTIQYVRSNHRSVVKRLK